VTYRDRDGVLPVDKPEGPTSHDVVAVARRALGERRVGHTGTLDPFASGLLLLCVGRATRLAQFLTDLDKTYEATARLGVTTDTEDREGTELSTSERWNEITLQALEAALGDLRGSILQTPPQFSAKKVGGEVAHRLARRGENVTLEPRSVTVHELDVVGFDPPDVRFRVRCSRGTYVRSLARDLGEALGVGAHLTRLRRTHVGPFSVGSAVTLEGLQDPDRFSRAWIDPLYAVGHLPRLEVGAAEVTELQHGRSVSADGSWDRGPVIAAHGEVLVAVGEVRDERFRPRKVFVHG
jgi:tRNA pseudouridine55 synthase